jgi:hypothetical protein
MKGASKPEIVRQIEPIFRVEIPFGNPRRFPDFLSA